MSELPIDKVARLEAELGGLRAARALASGGKQVEDVWRDGRRVKYSTFSLADFNDQERYLEGQLETAKIEAGIAVTSRRRPTELAWNN
jgi:muconolactone delta-isomerase